MSLRNTNLEQRTDGRRWIQDQNPAAYDDLIRAAFEYSCLEAEFLKIDFHTSEFISLCEIRENMALIGLMRNYQTMIDNGESPMDYEYCISSREEMLEYIRRHYKDAPKTDNQI